MISHPSYNLTSARPDTGSLGSGAGFRVRYLGSTTCSSKGRLKNGISGFQKPLLDLYVAARRRGEDYRSVHPLALTQHIDLCEYGVVVAETEEDLENGEEMPVVTKVITPLSNIILWAAVRFHTRIIKKRVFGAAFVPIACSDAVLDKNSFNQLGPRQRFLVSLTHPPIFTCVLQRVASPKTLECHSFVCESAEEALTLCSMLGELRDNCNRVGSLGLVPDDFIGYSYSRHFTRSSGGGAGSSVISPSDVSSRYASSYPSDETQTTQRIESLEEHSTRCSPYINGRRAQRGTKMNRSRENLRRSSRRHRSSFKETTPKKSRYVDEVPRRKTGHREEMMKSNDRVLLMHARRNEVYGREADSSSDVVKAYDKKRNQTSPASSRIRENRTVEENRSPRSPPPGRDTGRKVPTTIIQVSGTTPKLATRTRERMTVSHTMDFSSESELESALSPSERRLALRLPEFRCKQQTIPEEQEWGSPGESNNGARAVSYGSNLNVKSLNHASDTNSNSRFRCESVASMASSQQWILTREMGTMTDNDPQRIVEHETEDRLSTSSRRNSISSVDQLYAKPLKKSQRPCRREAAEFSEALDFSSESKSSSSIAIDPRRPRNEEYGYSNVTRRREFSWEQQVADGAGYRRSRSVTDIPGHEHRKEVIDVPYHAATVDRAVRGRREGRSTVPSDPTCIRITVPYGKKHASSSDLDASSYLGSGAPQHIPQGIRSFHKRGNVKNWSTLSQASEMSFEGSATLPIARSTRHNNKAIRWSSSERLSRRPSFLRSIKRLSIRSFMQAKKTTGKLISSLKTKIKDHTKSAKKGSETSEDSAYDTSEVCLRPDGNPPPSKPLRKAQRQMSWSFHDLRDSFPARIKKSKSAESKEVLYVNNERQELATKMGSKHKTKKKVVKKRRRRRASSNSMSSDSGVEEYHSDFSLPSHHRSESELEKFASEVTLVNVKHGLTERKFRRFSHTNLQNELGYIP